MELWNIIVPVCVSSGLDIIELMESPNVICIVHDLWDGICKVYLIWHELNHYQLVQGCMHRTAWLLAEM